MSAVQTTYSEFLRPAVAGQLANMVGKKIVSKTIEDAAGIGFGKAVARGSLSDRGCKIPTGSAVSIGITVRTRDVVPNNAGGADVYKQYDSVAVLIEGDIWVETADSVAPGDPVYVVPTTMALRNDNTGSGIQIPGATWETTVNNGLAVVRLK